MIQLVLAPHEVGLWEEGITVQTLQNRGALPLLQTTNHRTIKSHLIRMKTFNHHRQIRYVPSYERLNSIAHGGKLSPKIYAAKCKRCLLAERPESHINPFKQTKIRISGDDSNSVLFQIILSTEKCIIHLPINLEEEEVWILKTNGLLESVFVRTGLNDGRYTEINSMRLKQGDQIVLGATSNNDASSQQVQSPLTAKVKVRGLAVEVVSDDRRYSH